MGGGGKGSSAPAAPDYTGAAIAQGELGLQNTVAQSELNNPNTYTPYGSITYGGAPSGMSSPAFGSGKGMPQGQQPAGSLGNPVPAKAGGTTASNGAPLTVGGGGGTSGSSFNPLEPGVWASHQGGAVGALSALDPIGSTLGGKGKGASQPNAPSYNLGALTGDPGLRQNASINLAPAQQALLNSQQLNQNAAGLAGSQVAGSLLNNTTGKLDLSQLPNVNQGADQINNNVVNALYNQQKQYLDPQFAQEGKALNASLVAQGLGPQDTSPNEAAQNANTNFANQKQQAYSNALYNAQQGGTQAGYVASQENLAGAQQGLAQQEAQQQLPLSQLTQLLGISQPTVPGQIGNSPAGGAQPANLSGAAANAYQTALGNTNAQNAQAATGVSGLAGLGSILATLFAA